MNIACPQEIFKVAKACNILVSIQLKEDEGMVISILSGEKLCQYRFWREVLFALSKTTATVSCTVQAQDGPHGFGIILKNFNLERLQVALFEEINQISFFFEESEYEKLSSVINPVSFQYDDKICPTHPHKLLFHISRINRISIKAESINFVPATQPVLV